jgi:ribonuclease J
MPVGITVFDGAGTIGGNKVYLEFKGGSHDRKGLFFDFGTNFKTYGDYYEEFLVPRTVRGIHDLLALAIIPEISCYRGDLIPSDVSLAGARRLDPLAIFISHAHMDHVGNIGLLDRAIPGVATPMTAMILKAMQDCGSKMESEAAYITPRLPDDEETRLIEAVPAKTSPFMGRDFCLTGPCTGAPGVDPLKPFWESQPATRKLTSGALEVAPGFLDIEFASFEVDHSMYGAAAYAVNSDAGWIVYSGDLRKHGKFQDKTVQFASEAKKLSPACLIIEGTTASRKQEGGEISESTVADRCRSATEAETDLVIADFAARNFERLDMFREIAKKTGRELVVMMKDAYLLKAMQCVDGEDRIKDLSIYKDLKGSRDGFEKQVMKEYPGKLLDPADIAKSPGSYILCFSFFDIKHLLDIRSEGGTYIYSSSEAYGEEQKIDFVRLWNWLGRFKFTIAGFSIVDGPDGRPAPAFENGYHASGHASGEDILQIIKEINPGTVIPIHTEVPSYFKDNLPGMKVILPERGKEYIFQ